MLVLSREQRGRLFTQEAPRISGEGPCPVEKGQVVQLSKHVSLRIEAVRWKAGRWALRYKLIDRRDPARLLRRTPGIHREDFSAIRKSFDAFGSPSPPTAAVLLHAAEDSSYTSSPLSAISDAGEAVDARSQSLYSIQAKRHDELREQARRERWEAQSLADRVAALEGRTDDADLTRILASIERRVRAAEKKLRAT